MSDHSKVKGPDKSVHNQHVTVENNVEAPTLAPPPFQLKTSTGALEEEGEGLDVVQQKAVESSNFGAADAPSDDGSGNGAGSGGDGVPGTAMQLYSPMVAEPIQRHASSTVAQLASVDVNLLGDDAKTLAFSYMGEYWDKLKSEFELDSALLFVVKELLDIIGLNVLESATKGLAETAKKLAGAVAQVTKILTILVKIKEWIDKVPKPIKEFLKFLLGHVMFRIGEWLFDEGLDDSTINKVVFGAEDIYAAFGSAIEQLQAVLDKLNGYISSGVEKITSTSWWQTGTALFGKTWDWLKEQFGDEISEATGELGESVSDLWGATKRLATPGKPQDDPFEADLKLFWLRIHSPDMQKWTETGDDGEEVERGGLVMDSTIGIRMSPEDFEADINVRVGYGGDYRFDLSSETPLLAGGVGIDGLFNLRALTLSRLTFGSEEGLEVLIMKLAEIVFGTKQNGLIGSDVTFSYVKDGEYPLSGSSKLDLNINGETMIGGDFFLGFRKDGKIGKGTFHLSTGDRQFDLIKNHLGVANVNASGLWENGEFKELGLFGDPYVAVPGARVDGTKVGLTYVDGEFTGHADKLIIQLGIAGATIAIVMNNAKVESDGFSSEEITVTFTGAGHEVEDSETTEGEDERTKMVQQFMPAFEASWLKNVLDIETVEMHISNAHIGWGSEDKEKSDDGSEPESVKTESSSVDTDDIVLEEKQNVFTLRRLKATVFGITADGSYNDEEEKFEGTISSKLFGQDSGRKPAEFEVATREGGAWMAELRDLALLPENRKLLEIMDVGPIVLNRIQFDSAEGITVLDLVVDRFGIGGDILAAEGITFNYTKEEGVLDTKTKIYLKLFQDNPKMTGDLAMTFGQDGSLIDGTASKEPAGETFNLLKNHIILTNPSFYANWNGEEGLKTLIANGNLELKIPQAKVVANDATFHYDKAEQIFKGNVASLSGKVRLGEETLIMVLIEGAEIDKNGLSADSIKLTFSYGDEEAPMEDLESVTKGGLGKLIPGFDPSIISTVGGIDTFVMDLTTTNVSYNFNDTEDEQTMEKAGEDSEKESETSLAIRKLKAHAFGWQFDGKYEDKLFEGKFWNEDFGEGEFTVDSSNPEQWVARAFDTEIRFGGRKLFNVFGMESIQLHDMEYASGEGMRVLNLTVNQLTFGNFFKTKKITGRLNDDVLEFGGTGVELDVFGHKLAGGFGIKIDKAGKPLEIKASLASIEDLVIFENVLKLTGIQGSVDWGKGALKSMNVESGVDFTPIPGIQLKASKLGANYEQGKGLTGNIASMQLGIGISEDLQMLLRMENAELSKGEGLKFTAESVLASFAYNKNIIEPEKSLQESKVGSLLPGLPVGQWLNFAGLKALVFTASANDVQIDSGGLKVASWEKMIEYMEGQWAGLEVGFNAGNAELGLGEETGDWVTEVLDGIDKDESEKDESDGTGTEAESSVDTGSFDPLADLSGKGGYVRGTWSHEVRTPSISIDFPIIAGLISVGGGIDAGLTLEAGVGAGLEKLPLLEDGKEAFRISGGAKVKGTGDLKIDLHASVGHQLIVAIQAGLFAKAMISAAATGGITGVVLWDREQNKMSLSKKAEHRPRVDVGLETALSAAVGAEIKAKAFIFFEKTLYSYEFKRWNLGNWKLEGSLIAKEGGGFEFQRTAHGFGGKGGIPTSEPEADVKVVVAKEVVESGKPIKDKRLAWRLYHDILDPDSGYSPEEQQTLLRKLQDITKTGDLDKQDDEGDLKVMMDEMRRRTSEEDHSLVMTPDEWDAYSTTDSTFLFWTNEKKRKAIKSIDMKVDEYADATTTAEKIRILEGTMTTSDYESKGWREFKLKKPEKNMTLYNKAGLIDLCHRYILEEDGGRRDMVAKMQSDASKELSRLKADSAPRRRSVSDGTD